MTSPFDEPRADSRPAFESPRMRAEPVEKRHSAAMVRVLNDPAIYRFLPDDPPTLAYLERHYEYLASGKSPDGTEHWLTWILVPRTGGGDPLGYAQATIKEPETVHVAYVLNPKHWKQGYGREVLAALLDAVFDHYRVERAIAEMDTRNAASIGLVRALGFRYVRTARDAAEFKGGTSHEHVYELTRGQWRTRSC